MAFASKRRWLRFSLRTVFVLVTVVALGLGWQLSIVRARRIALLELRENPAIDVYTDAQIELPFESSPDAITISKLRILLGDEPVEIIRHPAGHPESEIARLKAIFPEAALVERDPPMPIDGPTRALSPPAREPSAVGK
jgi:hypothetical protein